MVSKLLLSAFLVTAAPSLSEVNPVTVTDTGFALTWTTAWPVAGAVSYGTDPRSLAMTASATGPRTRFHYLSVTGLAPGVTYYYRIRMGDEQWPRPYLPPRSVTTLCPPPGRELFTFAVMNDLHAGEDIAGVFFLPVPGIPPLTPGFTWKNPVDNYWSFTLRSSISAINRAQADLCVINGDLTSWFTPDEFRIAKSYLDRLDMPYYVTRGNHDRVGDYPADYFLETFGLESSWYSVDHKGFHFIFLDDNRLADGWMEVPEQELGWLEADLAASRDAPTFIFEHHTVGAFWADVDKKARARLLRIFAKNPQVVGVFNGHSHRAKFTTVPGVTGGLPYIEVPSVKEYPVGYGLVRVYEGGFMYNFFMADCPDCLEWNHITRGEDLGMAPRLLNRKLTDRNMVYVFPATATRGADDEN
ncbi:MAG TPA: metallophosphoesterase family protein [bacterium]|nr:metallophosphoesterase family protein [bacterium]